jgi:membrane protease YdiL (CAAX protease family)
MIELVLVLLTAIGFQICEQIAGAKGPFIIATSIFWIGYVIARLWRKPHILWKWGFRRDGFGPAAIASAIALAAGALILATWGWLANGSAALNLPRSFWLALLLYPLWGLLQQFLLNALVLRNLLRWLQPATACVVAAALFGCLHLPDIQLAAMTAVAALIWTPIYLRWRNLWPLGICHGWLGAIAYYVVLRRDVWGQVMP